MAAARKGRDFGCLRGRVVGRVAEEEARGDGIGVGGPRGVVAVGVAVGILGWFYPLLLLLLLLSGSLIWWLVFVFVGIQDY